MKFRRFISFVTAAACCGGIISCMPPAAVYAEETAVYNGFEVNYDGWYPNTDNTELTAAAGMGYDGSRGMAVTGRLLPSDGASSMKGFYLTGGREYTYSAMVYSESDEIFRMSLAYGSADRELASEKVRGGEWTEIKAKYKAPADSGDFTLTLRTDSAADFRFDEVKITAKQDPYAVSAADNNKGLKDEFAGYFKVGNILNGYSVNNSAVTATILRNYNSITCENETKPDATLVQSKCSDSDIGVSLSRAAAIFDFCVNNNISVRGHTLVWHSQTPVWFFKDNFSAGGKWVTPEVMDKRMESYIKNMFAAIKTQYPKLDLYAYDVVNEAVSDDQTRTKGDGAREAGDNNTSGGKSAWVQVYGDNSFIEKAFTYAKKYAPASCKLFYNDYNEYWGHKRDCIYKMCKDLYGKGLLDGVGMQSHVNADVNGFSGISSYEAAMKKYLSIGCEVQITELDVSREGGKLSEKQQAEKYEGIFRSAMELAADPTVKGKITAVCLWGPNDANTWLGSGNAPMLHDKANQPKAAYDALIALVPASDWGKKPSAANKTDSAKKTETAKKETPAKTETSKKTDTSAKTGSLSDAFEKDTCGWSGKGSAAVSADSKNAHKGKGSLYVSKRSAASDGAQKDISKTVAAGKAYSFGAYVMYKGSDKTDTFYLMLGYKDKNGKSQSKTVAKAKAAKGKWTQLKNDSFTVPAGASAVKLYVRTDKSKNSFYADDVTVAAAKKSSEKKPAADKKDTAATTTSAAAMGTKWENNADISWIDTSKPMVALSFDDGPVGTADKSTSTRIQNALSSNGGHATFFYWGSRINASNEAEITRAQKLGFEVANHTYSHSYLNKMTADEIQKDIGRSADMLTRLTGQKNFLIRPPYLAVNDTVKQNAGAPMVTCAVDTLDWNNATAQQIIDKIKAGMEDGSLDGCVVLMHETCESTAEAMEYLAPYMKEQGWQIVTVSEMFKAKGKDMYAGSIYTKA